MSEKNLPIKVILQRATDIRKNQGGGPPKCFCEVTPELQKMFIDKFYDLLSFYQDVFNENVFIPAVAKITVKQEAIAKSHKPNDLCEKCPIIGGKNLNEIYIKVNQQSIIDTIKSIENLSTKKIEANLTAIANIEPITPNEKISTELREITDQELLDSIKDSIKIKFFDFNDEFDNQQISNYILGKFRDIGLENSYKFIQYGDKLKLIKMEISSYEDITRIASINGVKSIGFFQKYSLPTDDCFNSDLQILLDDECIDSEISIGIIDGGISKNNPYLFPYIKDTKTYVPEEYQNHAHGTFIASTIQYGNKLNNIACNISQRFKFIDIIAIPNGDANFGCTDGIGEIQLMEIIEEVMAEYASTVKIWNLSLGIENKICRGDMSDLGIFFDYIQDKYQVQFFVSSGNLRPPNLRAWPVQTNMGEKDRICSPADSVRAITVGSVALYDSDTSMVKANEPSPFSRRGPGANYIIKPDLVDYGGNASANPMERNLGMKGLDLAGHIVEDIGTSFSTPRIAQKFATIYDEMAEKDLLLAKVMLIHSARMESRELQNQNPENIKYYGFGNPSVNVQDILKCSEDEITLVFRQRVSKGTHLVMEDFPYPPSLIRHGKYFGQIGMTLAYTPQLDQNYGQEYCRANIDVSFGTYKQAVNGKNEFKGEVPPETTWDAQLEKYRVENGFKWSPIKSYYRAIKNGIQVRDGWKIRIDLTPRNDMHIAQQEFVLVVTIKDLDGNDIYSEVVNGLEERGYIINNLETRQKLRIR